MWDAALFNLPYRRGWAKIDLCVVDVSKDSQGVKFHVYFVFEMALSCLKLLVCGVKAEFRDPTPQRTIPTLPFSPPLRKVKQILGTSFPFPLDNKKVDLPELQGDPREISREKCRLAAEQVVTAMPCLG